MLNRLNVFVKYINSYFNFENFVLYVCVHCSHFLYILFKILQLRSINFSYIKILTSFTNSIKLIYNLISSYVLNKFAL